MGAIRIAVLFAAALGGAECAAADAQPYPVRPVRFVVPFAPGGANDLVARVVAQKLSDALGQPVVVDNRGGAGGTIGTDIVAKAPPDGHTLLIASVGMAVNEALYQKLPYDTLRDFAPVSLMGEQPNLLVVHPSVPVHTVGELLALARAKPGQISYGSGGVGSTSHLVTVLFLKMANIDMLHVPYKGLGPAVAALIGGQLQFAIANVSTAVAHVRANRLRMLAVTSGKRIAMFPDTPTVSESGVPGYETTGWYGLLVPAATPRAIIVRLNREIGKIMRSPALAEQFSVLGLEPSYSSPEAFGKKLRTEIDTWGKLIRATGAKPE